jgi:hypothetical protein
MAVSTGGEDCYDPRLRNELASELVFCYSAGMNHVPSWIATLIPYLNGYTLAVGVLVVMWTQHKRIRILLKRFGESLNARATALQKIADELERRVGILRGRED